MKGLCIPLELTESSIRTELEVKSSESGKVQYFRFEPVVMNVDHSDTKRVEELTDYIKKYNQDWELLQVYSSSGETSNVVYLLYRKITAQ